MRRKKSRPALQLEFLETRQALAGDVTVFAIGDTLHVRGDSADNGVAIYSPSTGVLNVTGLQQGDSATTINHVPTQAFTGINNVVVSLAGGNDALAVTNAVLAGSLTIQMGDGNDATGLGQFEDSDNRFDDAVDSLLGALTVNNNLMLSAGAGDDTLEAQNLTAKMMAVVMDNGADSVHLWRTGTEGDPEYIPGVTITKSLVIDLGEADNVLHMVGTSAQDLEIRGGDGVDEIDLEAIAIARAASITAGDGENHIEIDGMTARSLAISSGLGNDRIELENLTLRKGLSIRDNYGNDTISIEHVTAKAIGISSGIGDDAVTVRDVTLTGKLFINTGSDHDTVTLNAVTAKTLAVALDAGDDTLTIDNAAIAKKATISAGLGADQLMIERLSAASLTSKLGLGDDELSLQFAVITKKAKIFGEKGVNTYNDLGNNTFGKLDRRNFADLA